VTQLTRYTTKWLATLLICWTVSGDLIRTIDGDSFIARLEIWPNLHKIERVRVLGVDTPELRGPHREKALQAKAFTDEWLRRGPFQVSVCKRDSFGRALAEVTRGESVLADELILTEHATVYRPR
jgi:endonuclease YncB( thermonuclease family)